MWLVYTAIVIALVLGVHLLWRAWDRRQGRAFQREADEVASLGDVTPASLHPHIDPYRCIGSGACIRACPETKVLGIVGGHAQLVNPLACVGHGACHDACPVQAIELVFGTRSQGVELPRLTPQFETSQAGVYVVGELGGMGLIRNAVRQGSQVADAIAASPRRSPGGDVLDAIVVGAGPAGISAAAGLHTQGLRIVLLEQSELGGAIAHYPRGKVAMTGALDIPAFGTIKRRTMSKTELVKLWHEMQSTLQLPLRTGFEVAGLSARPDGNWTVQGAHAELSAANVVLALGRRGSPRKLGVPGEELSKVVYSLAEPEVFAGQHVMVVGGGNSAVEAALLLADEGRCASVSISYRRNVFARTRGSNRTRIQQALAEGRIQGFLQSQITRITEQTVELVDEAQQPRAIANHAVIVQIGGTAPTALLSACGVELVTKYGER